MDFYTFLRGYVDPTVVTFVVLLAVSFLFALYSIALMNRRMRIMHDNLLQIAEDNKLLNESIRVLQSTMTGQSLDSQPAPMAKPSAPKSIE